MTTRKRFYRAVGRLLVVAVAVAALIGAVLMPEESPSWLRELLGLREGDETATTPWVRWGLIALAVALLLVARLWAQTAWVDVAIAGFVILGAFAAYKEHRAAAKATVTVTPETAIFTLPQEKLTVEERIAENAKAIVVIVEPEKTADDRPLTYTSTRYEATVSGRAALEGVNIADVDVAIERGGKDATAVAFTADLAGATAIHLLPGPRETK